MFREQVEVVGLNKERKKGLSPKEKWNKGKIRYNQQRKEKYWADKNEINLKRREKYKVDKQKRLATKKEEQAWWTWLKCFNREECQKLGVCPWSKISNYSTTSSLASILKNWQEEHIQKIGVPDHNISIALSKLTPENLLKKAVKSKKQLATKKGRKVSDKKSPPYNPPISSSYNLLKEDLLFISKSERKEKGVVAEPRKVNKEKMPIVGFKPINQEAELFRKVVEMLTPATIPMGIDKHGGLWFRKGYRTTRWRYDLNELMKGKVGSWQWFSEDGKRTGWVNEVRKVPGIKGGVRVKHEGKSYWLYIIDYDFLKINLELQQRVKINFFNTVEKLGSWWIETKNGGHLFVLSETKWPAHFNPYWEDKFGVYHRIGDGISIENQSACVKFIGDSEKVFRMGKGKTPIVKDFEHAKSLYRQHPFYCELITKEEIAKNRLKIKTTFQKTQPLLENKEEILNEPVLNDINENNTSLMTKMLKYNQEWKNSYIVETQPQIYNSFISDRRFQSMRIRNLLTNQRHWVYLPIFGYCGLSNRKKPSIYKGGLFNFTLKQGHSLTFITNYTAC